MRYFHVSSTKNRDLIEKEGLLPKIGERRCFGNENLPAGIFLSKISPFDTTFDDDVYEVEIDRETTIDPAMEDAYFTEFSIPREAMKLAYKGTGRDKLFD